MSVLTYDRICWNLATTWTDKFNAIHRFTRSLNGITIQPSFIHTNQISATSKTRKLEQTLPFSYTATSCLLCCLRVILQKYLRVIDRSQKFIQRWQPQLNLKTCNKHNYIVVNTQLLHADTIAGACAAEKRWKYQILNWIKNSRIHFDIYFGQRNHLHTS